MDETRTEETCGAHKYWGLTRCRGQRVAGDTIEEEAAVDDCDPEEG